MALHGALYQPYSARYLSPAGVGKGCWDSAFRQHRMRPQVRMMVFFSGHGKHLFTQQKTRRCRNSLVKAKIRPLPQNSTSSWVLSPPTPQLALSGLAGITAILVSQKWSVTSFQNSGSSKGKAPFSWTTTGNWGFHNNVYTSNRGSKERR